MEGFVQPQSEGALAWFREAPRESEGTPSRPPGEALLQQLWRHQRLLRDRFVTGAGEKFRVLHPGFWNREAGPDFRQALIQFAHGPIAEGDIEVDVLASSWRAHGHNSNPAYRRVILHVVWTADEASPHLPTLALPAVLESSLPELAAWFEAESAQTPGLVAGECSAGLQQLSPEQLKRLLQDAALQRLRAKALLLHGRARQVGWEQALWEALFRALGYKQNMWAMQSVAECLPLLRQASPTGDPVSAWQARLLGLAGLLPADAAGGRGRAAEYVRGFWNLWWREREMFADRTLPRAAWRLSGLRPANHPQRRLALAAHWLANPGLVRQLDGWFTSPEPSPEQLAEIVRPRPDDYWDWYYTLKARRNPRPQPLLGAHRTTDLVMNALLPWFWIRSEAGKNETLRSKAAALYLAWPAGQDNAVLRLARQRLLGDGARRLPAAGAAEQQGLLQLVRDYCEHSNAICDGCLFPEWLADLGKPKL